MFLTQFAHDVFNNIHIAWTFILLIVRFTGFFTVVPGLGEGVRGIMLRMPAVMVLAFTSLRPDTYAAMPLDFLSMFFQMLCEYLFGMLIGIIPLFLLAGVQMAAQLASTSMGLGASQLIDPTTGGNVSDLARLCGDLTIIFFLMIGGDHVAIYAVSGVAGDTLVGSFVPSSFTAEFLINRSAHIFYVGALLASPVIVALLLTQFVMGLVTKAVPTVNIFIISFPLTIGIGLTLSVLALPDMMVFVRKEITGLESAFVLLLRDTVSVR